MATHMEALVRADGPALRAAVLDRIRALLGGARIDPADVECELTEAGSALHVHLTLPVPVATSLTHALAVRVLDAVRAAPGTYGQVDVHVSGRAAAA